MNYSIRPTEPGDAAGLAALRRMPGIFETGGSLPSDREDPAFFSKLGPAHHAFTAVLEDGTIVAYALLYAESNPRRRHVGSLGVMVRPDCQGQGIGTALLKTLLDLADNWLMLERVELTVFADNHRAIHLYEKLGFEKEGLKRMTVIRNGQYADEYLMARLRRRSTNGSM